MKRDDLFNCAKCGSSQTDSYETILDSEFPIYYEFISCDDCEENTVLTFSFTKKEVQ